MVKVSGGLAGLSAKMSVPERVQVATTGDSGSRWSTPTTLGNEPVAHITNRPWIAYGPTGVPVALWRNAYPPYKCRIILGARPVRVRGNLA